MKLPAEEPDKIDVAFSPESIKPEDEAEAMMTIKAADDAPLSEHTVKVIATPQEGKETSINVKVEKP